MTHRKIRTLEDGTRVYADYHRYKPMRDEDRTYQVRKPDDPRAVRFGSTWYLPLELLADEQRTMPETIPDAETLAHPAWCMCHVCRRPQATEVWRRWIKKGKQPRGESAAHSVHAASHR